MIDIQKYLINIFVAFGGVFLVSVRIELEYSGYSGSVKGFLLTW